MNIHVIRMDSVASTNEEAVSHAMLGGQEGLCIVSNSQTGGKGREGRTWHSPKNDGLYFSIILRPKIERRLIPILTLLCATAAHDTIERFVSKKPDIKWPNDILIDEKKIAGILAETCETNQGIAVVVGIGINLTTTNLPQEIRSLATSIEEASDTNTDVDALVQNLTFFIRQKYESFVLSSNTAMVIAEWSARSSYFKDKKVVVSTRIDSFEGVTAGLDPLGSLMVRLRDGRLIPVTAGDVTAVRQDDRGSKESTKKDVKNPDLCENK